MFCHPAFFKSQSMPRFAQLLKSAYEARGHEVAIWSPRPKFHSMLNGSGFEKWGGYIDQYLRFPAWVRKKLPSVPEDTLIVFCDQALGPWIPLIQGRPHVVHVHDLLALRSAIGDLQKENPTSLSGRIYQRYIRRGFRHARHFISVSKKTREDLHRFGMVSATTSEYVYNGLNFPYSRLREDEAQLILGNARLPVTPEGMLLHVGGGQWYKNLPGVIAIYAKYAAQERAPLPLWCVSPKPNAAVRDALATVPLQGQVLFFSNLENATLQAAYSHARLLLFPSFAEGFGWPIVEALACGCPVITSDTAPMNEFENDGIHFLPPLRFGEKIDAWANQGAAIVRDIISQRTPDSLERAKRAEMWARRFESDKAIDAYLAIYEKVRKESVP